MIKWLLIFFISCSAFADTSLSKQLAAADVSPMQAMAQIEKQPNIVITEFESELDNNLLVYEIEAVDFGNNLGLDIKLSPLTGQQLERKSEPLHQVDVEKRTGAQLLLAHNLPFSKLISDNIGTRKGRLVEAELEQDSPFNYIEIKFLADDGRRYSKVVNLETLKPMPILTLD